MRIFVPICGIFFCVCALMYCICVYELVCVWTWVAVCFARNGKEGYNRGTLCLSCQAPSSDPSTCICILPPKLSHQRQCQAKAMFQLTMIMGCIRTSHSGKPIHKDYWEYGPAAGIFVSTAGVFKFSHCPSFSDQRETPQSESTMASLSLSIIVVFLCSLLLPGRQWKPGSGSMVFNRLLFTGAEIETRL